MEKLKNAMKKVIDAVSNKYTADKTWTNADVMSLGQTIMDGMNLDAGT